MSQPVHFVAHFRIIDAERYRRYEKGVFPVLANFDATFITYDDDVTVLDGQREDGRTIIIRFADEDEFWRWWNSEEYAEIAPHRAASTETFSAVLVHAPPAR